MNGGRQCGVTLVEMLIVVTLIGLMAGISYPSVSAGVENLRLTSAADSLAGLLQAAWVRAERRQEPVEISIYVRQNAASLQGGGADFSRRVEMPVGVRILSVLPRLGGDDVDPRRYLVLPGGTAPRVVVELANVRGTRRAVSLDPRTGAAQIERLANGK